MRILVVDDEIRQLKGMKIGLRTEGHRVETAESGERARQAIAMADEPFDLLITDYLMKNMTGLELLKEVRQKEPSLPVLMMTAYGQKDLLIEAMHYQCTGFIEKPFSLDQLVHEIARIQKLSTNNDQSQAQAKVFAHIVHQINNPLCAILGNAQMALQEHPEGDVTTRRLQGIVKASYCIQEISKEILHKDKAHDPGAERTRIDIHWLLHDCLEMFAGLLAQQKITVEIDCIADTLFVLGSPYGLHQVIKNLLMNGIEAMDKTLAKILQVRAASADKGTAISIQIGDTGCGCPELCAAELPEFNTTTKENGSGIGLQVVRKILAGHKGQLSLRSRRGPGTIVTIKLPVYDR